MLNRSPLREEALQVFRHKDMEALFTKDCIDHIHSLSLIHFARAREVPWPPRLPNGAHIYSSNLGREMVESLSLEVSAH